MTYAHWTLLVLHPLIASLTAGHALLSKREPQTAFGWIAVCFMFPFGGPLLYFLFGVNRVHTRARKLHRRSSPPLQTDQAKAERAACKGAIRVPAEFSELARISDAVTGLPLTGGNRIEPLHNGEQAYPRMLEAIEQARHALFLTTYILESNDTGRRFVDALAAAAARGVEVRVIIDGVGELYSFPRATSLLNKWGVRVARFLPPKLFPPTLHINLRNHRKIMVADGCVAFTGGMNIGDRHLAAERASPSRVVDVHFRLTGPVVRQIERVFIEDWGFTTGERLSPSPLAPTAAAGSAICRTVVDGPNEDLGKLESVLVGAVSCARTRVSIMTPYFLPSRGLIAALQSAALRGVEATLVLPARSNLPYVHWATRHMLWELLQRGVRIYYQPPPFAHTKLFVVDDHYAQIGSANLDPRSLRLNFELAVEVYDPPLARQLAGHIESVRAGCREVSLREMRARPLPARLRDAVAWLFSPYL